MNHLFGRTVIERPWNVGSNETKIRNQIWIQIQDFDDQNRKKFSVENKNR
jgi:hypothetical protein